MAVRVLCYKVNLFYNKLIALGDAKNTIGCWISESCDLNDKKAPLFVGDGRMSCKERKSFFFSLIRNYFSDSRLKLS